MGKPLMGAKAWRCFLSCGDDVDFEGYTYSTVQINGQCWFAENLRNRERRCHCSRLNDRAWSTTSSGGRATFGEGASVCYGPAPGGDACNEAFSLASYGRLYNWHAVNDARGLCPSGMACPFGWGVDHVDRWDWWYIDRRKHTQSRFRVVQQWQWNVSQWVRRFPGGQRMNAGNFKAQCTDAIFWTSTALSSVQVWFRSMGWNLQNLRSAAEKNAMSVEAFKTPTETFNDRRNAWRRVNAGG